MKWNTPCKIGDKLDSIAMPTAYSVTPVLNNTGAVTAVLMSVDTLVAWDHIGIDVGELTDFIAELKTVAA